MTGILATKKKVLACDVHVHLLQFCAIASFGLVGLCQVCGIPLVVIVAVGIYRHSTLWRFASWVLYSFLLCGIPLVHVAFRSSLIAGLACAIIAVSRLSPVAVVVRLLRHPACRLLLDLLV